MELINLSTYDLQLWNDYANYLVSEIKSITSVKSIYICTKDNYTTTIKSTDNLEGITCNSEYEGVGKTIYLNNQNIVFLREEIAKKIEITNYVRISNVKDLNLNDQLAYYVLFHEIGHCIDNVNRKILPKHTFDPGTNFKIRDYLNFYFNNLTSEYLAEEYAKTIVSDCFIEDLYQNLSKDYLYMIKSYKKNKQLYKNDLLNHAISNLNAFNVFFNQYIKYLSLSNKNNLLDKFIIFSNIYFQFNININNISNYFRRFSFLRDEKRRKLHLFTLRHLVRWTEEFFKIYC